MALNYDEMMKAKKFWPLHLDKLPPEIQEKARVELKETEENKAKCIKEMKDMIRNEPHFTLRDDDDYLLQFLRVRKFNSEKAFETLKRYYRMRYKYNDIYGVVDFELWFQFFKTECGALFPYRDRDGCCIWYLRTNAFNPEEFSVQTGLRAMSLIALHAIQDEATVICGIKVIADVKGASIKQLRYLTPYYMQLISLIVKNVSPVRLKEFHILNESAIAHYVYSLAKFFVKKKILKRVHFHGDNLKSLQNYFPKEILPEMLGGDLKDYSVAEWCERELPNTLPEYNRLFKEGYSK